MDIDCLMIGEPIPAELCSAEQGSHHCDGCAASTRRCLACQKARGIADAYRGLCAVCAAENPRQEVQRKVVETVVNMLDGFNNRIDNLLDLNITNDKSAQSKKDRTAPLSPPILGQPDLIYGALCEHAAPNGQGAYVVRHVMRVLATRARLTEDECRAALRKLMAQGQIELLAGGEIRLLSDLETVMKIIARRGEEYTVRGTKSRAKKRQAPRSEQTKTASAGPPPFPAQPAPTPSNAPPTPRGPSIGDIFRFVREMSTIIGTERVARAVVPTIGVRLKLGTQAVIAALEKLEQANAIIRKDGWRTITILKDEYGDSTPVVMPKIVTSPPPRGGSGAPKGTHGPRRERLHLRVVPNPEESAADSEVPPPPAGSALNEAIERLEHTLPNLRQLRDQVNAKVAMLELSLSQLKNAKAQTDEAEASSREALAQAEVTMTELLQALRRKA